MASQKQTSKKRSVSSSASLPEAAPLLFIDRCAWSRKLGEALNVAGIRFVAHHEKFVPACPDEEWMKAAGREGWIVLTRDQAIRRKAQSVKPPAMFSVTLAGGINPVR